MATYFSSKKRDPLFSIFENLVPSGEFQSYTEVCIITKLKTKLRGFGRRANYADQATAACWRSSANFCG
jgi:hypothetical protein